MYGILDLTTIHDSWDASNIIATIKAPVNIVSNQVTSSSDTLSLRRRVSVSAAQRWEIEVGLYFESDASKFLVNIVTRNISDYVYASIPNPFRLNSKAVGYGRDPTKPGDVARATGYGTVSGAQPSGSSLVTVNMSGGAKVFIGDFIQFGSNPKTYMVKAISTSGASASIQIFPKLVQPLANITPVRFGDRVVFKARYDTDAVKGITYADGVMAEIGAIKLIEAIQ